MTNEGKPSFTADRYELTQGRFLIFPTDSGQLYTEVDPEFTEESPGFKKVAESLIGRRIRYGGAYQPFIFEGFMVVDSENFNVCFEQLVGVATREEADKRLAQMKAEVGDGV